MRLLPIGRYRFFCPGSPGKGSLQAFWPLCFAYYTIDLIRESLCVPACSLSFWS